MLPDTEGIHPIANTENADRVADIVFVHGLGGKSHGTWRHEDGFFWPEELGSARPDCGIWTVGYPAGFTSLGERGMSIEKRGGNLANQLTLKGIGQRPVIFITHSMGGLVVKSLIVDSLATKDQRHIELAESVRGIAFCGTPHRGADIAAAGVALQRYFATGLAALLTGRLGWLLGGFLSMRLGLQHHVQQMATNAEPLDHLHDKFLAWHQDQPVLVESYAEHRPLCKGPISLGVVVKRGSANPGIGLPPYDVDADHLSLVKPPTPPHVIHDIVFGGVLRFIDDALKPPSPFHKPSILVLAKWMLEQLPTP